MQSGLTLEALNHLGHDRHRLLIVLNDNEMSISPSVGGLSTRLNKLRLTRAYQGTKSVTQRMLPRMPIIGRPLFDVLAWAKEGFKRSWAKVGFFEDMGITYIGVLDGHDLAELEQTFERAFACARRCWCTSRRSRAGATRPPRWTASVVPRRQPAADRPEPDRSHRGAASHRVGAQAQAEDLHPHLRRGAGPPGGGR